MEKVEQMGMRQKERQREMTQQGESAGWSATRSKPHLFSASLPIWTINQQREQGKINKNSTAETTAKCSIASLRPTAFYIHQATLFSQSPLPPVTSSILDSFLFPLQVLFLFSSCLPYSSLSLWLMLASHFWVIYIFFESLHLNLKIKTQWRSSGKTHYKRCWWKRTQRFFWSHLRNLNWNTTDSVLSKHRHVATVQNVH